MCTKFLTIALVLPLIFINQFLLGQKESNSKIAILPVASVGVDESIVQSAQAILRLEMSAASNWDIVSEADVSNALGDQSCDEPGCAREIGNRVGALKVLICNLTGLGEKILVHYSLIDVASGTAVLKDNATALIVEDLDAVLKRVAISVGTNKPIERTAEVNNITANESLEPLRRGSNTLTGFTFGYLFPQEGYDNDDRSFSFDFRVAHEIEPFEVGLLLAVRKGFAVNVFGNYLLTRKDICPYLGGAFGFHWVKHDQYDYYDPQTQTYRQDNRHTDGFELTANGGVKLFRTYNFQILLNFAYLVTFNDYDDRATVFTFGLVK
jgi:hypothetical protein